MARGVAAAEATRAAYSVAPRVKSTHCRGGARVSVPMPNPPAINFVIPFHAVAVRVIVNSNGVQPDGTNVPTPDTTSTLVIAPVSGPSGYSAAIDPGDNRRVIITPGLLTPGGVTVAWSFRISVAGRIATVTVSGSTPAPADLSGVIWDGNPIAEA
jgi:hypothetical protein